MKLIKYTILLFLLISITRTTLAQNGDYEKYPPIDIELLHLDGEIRIDSSGLIEGDVKYNARVQKHEIEMITLDAARLSIHSVSVNDEPVEHRFEDHKLIIELGSVAARGDELNFRIVYDTNPVFGVHQNDAGTIWTSQLPKSTKHWLPVIDHPRVEFTTDIRFTHPSGFTVAASGVRGQSELLNVDEETVTFTSNQKIPATALSWATGNFDQILSTADSDSGLDGVDFNTLLRFQNEADGNIHFYFESDGSESGIQQAAINAYLETKNELGINYPFQDLHIVVLDDDFWETKTYAAGIMYVYKNRGGAEKQVKRGILAQWIGVMVREEQWSDSDAIIALQAILMNRLYNSELIAGENDYQYDIFSDEIFSRWQNHFDAEDTTAFMEHTEYALNKILDNSQKILGWNELSDIIYNETGQPYFEGFTPAKIEAEEKDTVKYIATIDWEEGESTARIRFEADGDASDELITVTGREITFTDERSHEIIFSGRSEAVIINVSTGIENIKLSVDGRDDVQIREIKPFMFWLHQLRNSDDVSRRMDAATGIAQFPENPDLQLALNDVLQFESDPAVYAQIIRSMSQLTIGASGTEERFIQNTSANQHRSIQLAAVESLRHFENNQRVISRLRSIINQTEDSEIRRTAIKSLYDVSDTETFLNAVQTFVTRESVINEVPLMLNLLAEKGEAETAVDIASTFAAPEFSYTIRKGALGVMIENDQSPANWMNRLPGLLSDHDPRIRHQATGALAKLNSQQRNQVVSQRIDDEFDARVRAALR